MKTMTTMVTGHDGVSRRRFLALAGGLAGSAILAACGGTSATSTPKPALPTVAPTIAPAATAAATVAAPTRGATTAAATAAAPSAASAATIATRPAGTAVAASAVSGTTAASSAVSGSASGQALVIQAVEYGFQTMGSIPAGVTTVQLKNLGKEHHEAQIVRLNEGVTLDQLLAALQQQGAPPPIFTYEGGPAEVVPGRTAEVMMNFTPGQYALLCFVSAPDGMTHAAKGMYLPITVNAASGSTGALPEGKGTLALGGGALTLPAILPAGRSMYRVTNGGQDPHAFFYGRIPADKTVDDVIQAASDPNSNGPPPWFEPFGGMDGLKPGGAGNVVFDLAAGNYAAVDITYAENSKPVVTVFKVS